MTESSSQSRTAPPTAAGVGPPPAEAHDLVMAAQGGDYGAFERLVHLYHGRIYRLSYGMLKNANDAEEVVQETFLNVFRHLGSFKQESAPGSWIYRIAVNAALMRLRSQRRKPLLSLEDHGVMQGDPSSDVPFWSANAWARQPEAQLASQEISSQLEQTIDKLPEKYRLVLLLRDVEGRSNDEVANALGLTLPTVKSRLHRARLFVRQELELYFRRR